MSGTFDDIWPGSNGAGLQSYYTRAGSTSGSVTFDRSARVRISALAGGGSGAIAMGGYSGLVYATPGNTSPWGRKTINVQAGDVLSWAVGAGGAAVTSSSGGGAMLGKPGGATVIMLNGIEIMRVNGGEGGVFGTAAGGLLTDALLPPAAATVVGADVWRAGLLGGVLPASGGSTATARGSAPDLAGNGLGRGSSAAPGSVGSAGGSNYIAWAALMQWGIGAFDSASATAPGKGGGGIFGGDSAVGGGSGQSAARPGEPTGSATSGKGADGYVFIEVQLGAA